MEQTVSGNARNFLISEADGTSLAGIIFYVPGIILRWKFFFFKQKTAYEIASCLVGSEMCIRDRTTRVS